MTDLKTRQIKALEKSIKHWKRDIVRWLEGGYEVKWPDWRWCDGRIVKIGGGYCACCIAFGEACTGCPLNTPELDCNNEGSLYQKFTTTPTLENSRMMVEAMETKLKELKQ